MKKFNSILMVIFCLSLSQFTHAQLCSGIKGPNLLGAKGTFSDPYITVNANASACLTNGSNSYNPAGNIGNQLEGCSASTGDIVPCSDYVYRDQEGGMEDEFTYTLVKVMGDDNGSNCIHEPIWKASDRTGDGGYFMAVNGAPNVNFSTLFYQIKRIPVCIGTTYEFAAWVINMMPAGSTEEAPNVSFVVNGATIGNSGPIPYDRQWHQVGGSFTATTDYVDLQVINATQVSGGNDLGLDDISIRVCESHIEVSGAEFSEVGTIVTPSYRVFDPLRQNNIYKFQFSPDGGTTWVDNSEIFTATFDANNAFVINHPLFGGVAVSPELNGYIFRLIVSTSIAGLDNPDCIYFNDYRLIVVPEGTLPVQLTSFDGSFSNGTASLKWQTSQEVNSDRFELYRSYDGINFELATSVKSAGNSSTVKNYNYNDRIGSNTGGHVFYRLKQIDLDGKFSFSDVIKLSLDNVNAKFQLFPNPVVNNFTASFTAPKSSTATLLIRNTNGQTVYTKVVNVIKGSNSVAVNNAPLKTGMYYVTIGNDDFHYNGKLQKK